MERFRSVALYVAVACVLGASAGGGSGRDDRDDGRHRRAGRDGRCLGLGRHGRKLGAGQRRDRRCRLGAAQAERSRPERAVTARTADAVDRQAPAVRPGPAVRPALSERAQAAKVARPAPAELRVAPAPPAEAAPPAAAAPRAAGRRAPAAPGTGGAISAGTIFVAPNGDDTNPGTMAQPFKTVAKARDVVRGMTATMTADITVYLRGGTYPQTSTLTFGNADSGKNGFYVKYLAYPSERPIITGGQPITGMDDVRARATTSTRRAASRRRSGSSTSTASRRSARAARTSGTNGALRLQPAHRRRQHRAEHPGRGVGGRELEQPHQGRDARDDRLGRQHLAPGVV